MGGSYLRIIADCVRRTKSPGGKVSSRLPGRPEGANLIEPSQVLADSAVRDVLIRCLVLLAILIAGLVTVLWLRRRFSDGDGDGGADMQSFEQMHRSGLISDEEFRRLRNTALGVKDKSPEQGKTGSSEPPADDDDNADDAPEATEPSARQRRDQRET